MHVLLVGQSQELVEIAEILTLHGHLVTLVPGTPGEAGGATSRLIRSAEDVDRLAVSQPEPRVLLTSADEHAPLAAHRALPARDLTDRRGRTVRYDAGERIIIQYGSVLRVQAGAIGLTAVHPDGTEVMIGMLGPGDFLLPHPEDTCRVEAIAQIDVRAELLGWEDLAGEEVFAAAVASRVLKSEAWAASQAHPYIEQRLLGILNLLAEQFGVSHEGGRMIDLRLTHGQLAAITGTTRPTITRVIATLSRTGHVGVVGSGSERRLCVFNGVIGV